MFDHFKVRHPKRHHPQVDPELVGEAASLLMKIIGLTVKGRVARAVLAAGVAGATAYLSPSQSVQLLPSSEPQPVPMVSLPPEQAAMPPNTTCSAGRLDWQGTAAGR